MKNQTVSLSTQTDTLGLSFWATILNPNDGDYVDIFLMQSSGSSPLPHFAVCIHATSPYNIPALAAKALAQLVEKEAEYRQQALQVVL